MSIACVARVWQSSEQKGSKLLLMLAIADYADDNGFAWPGLKSLAEKTRLNLRHTTRLITELSGTNELIVFNRRAKGNVYIIRAGATTTMTETALRRAETFGIESDNLALYSDIFAAKVTTCHLNVTPTSLESDIAMSHDPSVTINDPSSYNSEEETGQDDAWLEKSRIVAIPDSDEEPEPESSDPLIRAVIHAQRKKSNWAVPADAGGADDYAEAPIVAFCQIVGIAADTLTEKKRRAWAKELRGVAEEWGVGPPLVAECIASLPFGEYAWKTYSSPYQDGFKNDLGVVIGQHLTEQKHGKQEIVVEIRPR